MISLIGEVVLRDLADVFGTSKSYPVKTYTFNGATGLSMAELLLAVCLYRANSLERQTVENMGQLSDTTAQLEIITGLANNIVNVPVGVTYNPGSDYVNYKVAGEDKTDTAWDYITSDKQGCLNLKSQIDSAGLTNSDWDYDKRLAAYNIIKTKMDSLNSISQESMIELQALVNKRDQAYNLASNGAKLMMNSSLSIAGNF